MFTESDDYTELSTDLTFVAPLSASSDLTASVSIQDDSVLEPCEDFLVSLSSTDPAVVSSPAFIRVKINDDEGEWGITNWFTVFMRTICTLLP